MAKTTKVDDLSLVLSFDPGGITGVCSVMRLAGQETETRSTWQVGVAREYQALGAIDLETLLDRLPVPPSVVLCEQGNTRGPVRNIMVEVFGGIRFACERRGLPFAPTHPAVLFAAKAMFSEVPNAFKSAHIQDAFLHAAMYIQTTLQPKRIVIGPRAPSGVLCDGCGTAIMVEADSYGSVDDAVNRAGWSVPIATGGYYLCPQCTAAPPETRNRGILRGGRV